MEKVIRSSLDKSGSWIHPTHTRVWSHSDSNGCMNLYRPQPEKSSAAPEPAPAVAAPAPTAPAAAADSPLPPPAPDAEGPPYPYDVFLSWFFERGLVPGPGPEDDIVPLVVVPFEYVHEPGTKDVLMKILPPDIFDRARAIQGRQLGELP